MNKIITIGREFVGGGRELGRRPSEELGIAYYDQGRVVSPCFEGLLERQNKKSAVPRCCE